MSSSPPSHKPAELFYSYAHEDGKLRNVLEKHLSILKRLGVITEWYDRKISAGEKWDGKIDEHLNTAQIILLLISPDFMASDYCYETEVTRAMERHRLGEALVIPVFLRPVMWKGAPFGEIQGLPTDAKSVTEWSNRDKAFLNIAEGIREAVEKLPSYIQSSLPVSAVAEPASLLSTVLRPLVVGFVTRRDSEGRDLLELLKEELAPERSSVIVLWGAGGVGKTTLAIQAASALSEAFGQRIVWASPESRADFNLNTLLDEIATQLGRDDLRQLALEPKEEAVRALIAAAPALIILDNFETIAPDEQPKCEGWLVQRAPCSAIITTRQRVMGARNVSVTGMSRDEAHQFIDLWIKQASKPHAFEGLERDSIIEAADHNPLVMRWVLAQINETGKPVEVLEKLKRGEGDAAQRVFDGSFNLPQLGDDGRDALLALSLFVPDASRDALSEVAGFDSDGKKRLNDAVARLSSLWLVEATMIGKRLKIEGLTRELAKNRLSKDARADEFRQRFVAYFVRYVEAHPQSTPEDFDALEAEKDNTLSAIDIAFEANNWLSVIRLMNAINLDGVNGMLAVRGYWDETIKYNYRALDATRFVKNELGTAVYSHRIGLIQEYRGLYDEARQTYEDALIVYRNLKYEDNIAVALYNLAALVMKQGDLIEARRLCDESLEISKKLGEQSGIATALQLSGIMARQKGDLIEARRLYDESLKINKKLGDQIGISYALHNLAIIAQEQGDLIEAQHLYDESLEIRKKIGDQSGIASTLHELGRLAQAQGKLAEARRLYDESLEINKRLGNQSGIASALHQLAMLAQAQGELAEARRLYNESLEINKRLGNQSGIASALHQLAMLAQDEGELKEARRLYDESLEIKKKLGNQSGIAISLHQLAMLAQAQGELKEARRLYDESLEIKKKLGDQSGIAISLHGLGRLAENEGDKAEAARLFREALSIFERLRSPYAEIARRSLERVESKDS